MTFNHNYYVVSSNSSQDRCAAATACAALWWTDHAVERQEAMSTASAPDQLNLLELLAPLCEGLCASLVD